MLVFTLIAAHCMAPLVPIAEKIAWHESRFETSVINSSGDYGVFQLNYYWQSRRTPGITEADLLDPKTNTILACQYLEYLYNKYSNTEPNWWSRFHSYRASHRRQYEERVKKDYTTLPKKVRIHEDSDPIPPERYDYVHYLVKRTEFFCRERRKADLMYLTVRYFAARRHWDVLYRCVR